MSSAYPNSAGAPAPSSPSPCPHAHAELLSEDTKAVWSPRLSPDHCRIIYLENDAMGPHQQCSRLRMVSGTRGTSAGCPCCSGGWQQGSVTSFSSGGNTRPVLCFLQYDWYTEETSTVLEVVPRQVWGECSPEGV